MDHRGPRVKAWCFTVNNTHDFGVLDALLADSQYLVVGRETAPSTGTPHLQGYVYMTERKRLSQMIRYVHGAHFEASKGSPESNKMYCTKEGDFFEQGEIPDEHVGPMKRAKQFQDAYQLAKSQKVSDVEPEIQLKYLGALNKIADRELPITAELDDVCGVWLWGPPGTGKTRAAISDYGGNDGRSLYRKLPNKWWDHYKGEPNVLLDDLSPSTAQCLVQYIKQWMDRYPFKCEYKGGARDLRPQAFIVTSNYSIEECFPDPRDAEAIKRRCDVTHYNRPLGSDVPVRECTPEPRRRATHGLDDFRVGGRTRQIGADSL